MSQAGIQNIGQIAVTVKDIERATAFYRDVLGLDFLFSAPPGLAFFDVDGVRLMLSLAEGEFAGSSVLYFRVPDIDSVLNSIRPHCEVISEPHLIATLPDHDLWMAFFRDSEANPLAFMEERPR